jgi:hypothetical protein
VRLDHRVIQGLLLRRWILEWLSGLTPSRTEFGRECCPETWNLLTRAERFALPLRSWADSGRPLCSPEAYAGLLRLARRELHRILLARRQCKELGTIALTRGIPVVLLKSGRNVLESTALVDLSDIDVLAPEGSLSVLRLALLDAGYRETGGGSSHRLRKLVKADALPIEVHFAVPGVEPFYDVWSRVEPRQDGSGLWDLSAADRLWHLLLHSVVQHPNRRGRLREVYLAMAALKECSPKARGEVTERIDDHPFSEPLKRFLSLASNMVHGCSPPDWFAEVAASSYLWEAAVTRCRVPASMSVPCHSFIFSRMGGRSAEVPRSIDPGIGLERPSGFPFIRALQQRYPRMVRFLRLGARSIPLWAAAPVTSLLAFGARRIVGAAARQSASLFRSVPLVQREGAK